MLTEYTYWVPQLGRVRATEDPLAALAIAAELLEKQRPREMSRGPREALLLAATQMLRWCEQHHDDAARVFDAIIKTAHHQLELLIDQSVQRNHCLQRFLHRTTVSFADDPSERRVTGVWSPRRARPRRSPFAAAVAAG